MVTFTNESKLTNIIDDYFKENKDELKDIDSLSMKFQSCVITTLVLDELFFLLRINCKRIRKIILQYLDITFLNNMNNWIMRDDSNIEEVYLQNCYSSFQITYPWFKHDGKTLRNIKKLIFDNCCLPKTTQFPYITSFPNLQELSICENERYSCSKCSDPTCLVYHFNMELQLGFIKLPSEIQHKIKKYLRDPYYLRTKGDYSKLNCQGSNKRFHILELIA